MSSWVKIGRRDHNTIRRSQDVRNALAALAADIAAQANAAAGITPDVNNGYKSESPVEPNPDVTVGGDRARAHVWAAGEAVGIENADAILMGIAASQGGA